MRSSTSAALAETSPELLPEARQPRPSEVAQGNELWKLMLDECPPAHREILFLKRQGLPLAEIAARSGLHEGSIRRILYDLARKLAVSRRRASSPADDENAGEG